MVDKDTLIVDGFVFQSYKEAQAARKEKKNIEIIRERTSLDNKTECLKLYEKLIEREIFKTVVGYSFLHELRNRLLTEFGCEEQSLPTIPLPRKMEYDQVSEMNQSIMQNRFDRMIVIQKRLKIVIAALAVMVVAMFVIAAVNPNSAYLNTENKVLDKYASWQEELEQREQAVKEKEAELHLESDE